MLGTAVHAHGLAQRREHYHKAHCIVYYTGVLKGLTTDSPTCSDLNAFKLACGAATTFHRTKYRANPTEPLPAFQGPFFYTITTHESRLTTVVIPGPLALLVLCTRC